MNEPHSRNSNFFSLYKKNIEWREISFWKCFQFVLKVQNKYVCIICNAYLLVLKPICLLNICRLMSKPAYLLHKREAWHVGLAAAELDDLDGVVGGCADRHVLRHVVHVFHVIDLHRMASLILRVIKLFSVEAQWWVIFFLMLDEL